MVPVSAQAIFWKGTLRRTFWRKFKSNASERNIFGRAKLNSQTLVVINDSVLIDFKLEFNVNKSGARNSSSSSGASATLMCSYVSGLGQPSFDPRMMVSLLLHGYASGLCSVPRRIARACCERNDFVMIVALDPPDGRLCLHQHGSTQTVDLVEQIGGVTNFHDGHSPDERRPILNLRRRTCRRSRV